MSKKSNTIKADSVTIEVAGVEITHPEKMMYPNLGVTKLDLARYYQQVSKWILPWISSRPLSVIRCPGGRQRKCFFQRHYDDAMPEAVHSITLKEQEGDTEPYILVEDLAGLISLVQIGVLELHPWGSRAGRLNQPDWLVFDLDPDPSVEWPRVVAGAQLIRDRLHQLGLSSFVKTSGGKGLHVMVPLDGKQQWEEISQFAAALALDIARRDPNNYVANMSKAARKGKIFIDHLRNARSATSVAAYSTRAKAGAPVSTPLTWDELDQVGSAQAFNVQTVVTRMNEMKTDPWKDFFKQKQSITLEMQKDLQVDGTRSAHQVKQPKTAIRKQRRTEEGG